VTRPRRMTALEREEAVEALARGLCAACRAEVRAFLAGDDDALDRQCHRCRPLFDRRVQDLMGAYRRGRPTSPPAGEPLT